jgi:hypothetical protein
LPTKKITLPFGEQMFAGEDEAAKVSNSHRLCVIEKIINDQSVDATQIASFKPNSSNISLA